MRSILDVCRKLFECVRQWLNRDSVPDLIRPAMESASATTSSHLLTSHPLPHQQFSSRIAYANNYSKSKVKSLSKQKSTRLPPITRYDSICSPPNTNESIRYFNISADSNRSSNGTLTPNDEQSDHRIRQLEWNLNFVQEDCRKVLEALHLELEELKIKNRGIDLDLRCARGISQKYPFR